MTSGGAGGSGVVRGRVTGTFPPPWAPEGGGVNFFGMVKKKRVEF